METEIGFKVLVSESDSEALDSLKIFLDTNNLFGLRCTPENILQILETNIDLSAIILCKQFIDNTSLLQEIHRTRSELPIFVHAHNSHDPVISRICKFYSLENLPDLQNSLSEYLLNPHYPPDFIRGIQDVARRHLSIAPGLTVETDAPYLVRDRYVHGELFSIMELDSGWCRGYMLLQTSEEDLKHLLTIRSEARNYDNADRADDEGNFRESSSYLSELTNLMWGEIKSKFFRGENTEQTKIQVPIMVHHQRKFVSFGGTEPLLCFRHIVRHESGMEFTFIQWLVFNIYYCPERFKRTNEVMDELIEEGGLELF